MVLIKHPIGSRGGGVNDSPFARSPTLAARTLTQMSTNTGGLPGRCPLYLRKRTLIADPKLSAKRQCGHSARQTSLGTIHFFERLTLWRAMQHVS